MTTFELGPAFQTTLMLRRSPVYLRVVQSADGKIDALDQPEDAPAPGETCTCYMLAEYRGQCFVDGPKIRGRYTMAKYRWLDPQPAQRDMQTNPAWHAWVDKHAAANNTSNQIDDYRPKK